MAHEIFGDRFIGKREPAWHGIGEVFEDNLTATEAVSKAKLDFKIKKLQNRVLVDEDTYVMAPSYSVVREPTDDDPQHRILGNVGEAWTPVQASDLARMLDPIAEKYPVETAGALKYGKKIFLTLNAGDATIAGEEHQIYYLVTDNRGGGGSLNIALTPVRVVCQNTLVWGLENAKVNVTLRHDADVVRDAEWYLGIVSQMLASQEQAINTMTQLSEVKITNEVAKGIVDAAYPNASIPKRMKLSNGVKADDVPAAVWQDILLNKESGDELYENRKKRIENHKSLAMEAYDIFNQQHPDNAETPWAIYNAVVEAEDFRKGAAGRQESALYGKRAQVKVRAFDAAVTAAQLV